MPGILELLNRRVLGNTYPPPEIAEIWEDVELLAALRMGDRVRLRQEASVSWRYPYLITPVPRMISRAKSNMLFGEPPEFDHPDTDRMNFVVSENAFDAELHRGAMIASSEGEVWGRILVQPALLDAPIIEFVSRERVIPHFSGRFVVGATFVTEWQEGRNDFFRLFETYEAGLVSSRLHRGTSTSLGPDVPLDSYPRTEGVQPDVLTGVDRPLCAFIPNSIDTDPTRGYSDYRGLEERFLALNKTSTTGQANHDLAGKKRAVVDADYLDANGKLSKDDDILIRKNRGTSIDSGNSPLQLLEYNFDASATIAWLDHLIDTTLVFAGVSPQSVGRSVDGGAVSGTALKLKMTHSLMEAAGTGRFFDRGATQLLRFAAVIDSRPTTQGGFGRRWSEPETFVTITRGDGLPSDDMEAAQRLVLLTNAEAISVEEKVRTLHPDWTEDDIQKEIAAIGAASANDPNSPLTFTRPPIALPSTTAPQ